jgi:hypothetical protein
MHITITAFGETELSRELLSLATRAESPIPALDAIHERFLRLEGEQFASSGAYTGSRWAPLAQATVTRKAEQGLDPNILVATGALRSSLTDGSDEHHVYQPSAVGAEMYSTVPYGIYHQSRAPRKHLPRRPPVVLPEGEKVEWLKILQRWIVTGEVIG